MACPPFTVKSAEVATCWEQLSKLLQQEQEQIMLDDIQQSVGYLPFAAEADGSPVPTIDCIKLNLGVEREFSEDLEEITEAYNTAVCRTIGPDMHSKLPRELREMIYEHLTMFELVMDIKHPNELYGRVQHLKCAQKLMSDEYSAKSPPNDPYFASQPRSEKDRLCPEHYWRDEVVSPKIAHELMESWYRNIAFRLSCTGADRHQCVKALLNNDRYGMGLRPRELITKFTTKSWLGDRVRVGDDGVLRCLDELFWFRKATEIQVHIAFFSCRDEVRTLSHVSLRSPKMR